jgi:O-antigen/teichoic acid export membrane protein
MSRVREGAADGPNTGDVLDSPEAGVKALRGSVVRGAGYGIGLLLGLVSAPLLIRHLGIVDFGRYITVAAVVGLVAGVSEGGLNAMALREYARNDGEARRAVMRDMLGMRLVLTTVAAVGAVVFSTIAGYDSEMVLGTVGAAVALLFLTSQDFLAVGLQGELRFGLVTAAELVRQVTLTALIVALVLGGAGLVPLLWAPLPAGIVGVAFAAMLVRHRMPLRPTFDWQRWRPLLIDTLPYAVAVAIGIAYFRAAILVSSLVASPEQVGYFATSFRIVEMLLGVPVLLIGAAYPILARASVGDSSRHTSALRRILELAFLAGAFLALLTALAAPFAVRLLAGAEFGPSVPVLRIQALALAANFVAVAASYGLLSAGRNRSILAANACALTSTVVLNLVLASQFGAKGAAIATAAAEWLLAAALVAAVVRVDRELRSAARIVVPVATATAAGAAAIALPVPSIIQTAVGGLVFLAVITLLRRFPPEVSETLRSRSLRSAA